MMKKTIIIAGDCQINATSAKKVNAHIGKSFFYLKKRSQFKEQIESIAKIARINRISIKPKFNQDQHPIYEMELVFPDYYKEKIMLENFSKAMPEADIIFEFPNVIIAGHQHSSEKMLIPLKSLIQEIHASHIKAVELPAHHSSISTSSHRFLQIAGLTIPPETASYSSSNTAVLPVEGEALPETSTNPNAFTYRLKAEDKIKGILVYDGESKAFFMNSSTINIADKLDNKNSVMPNGFIGLKGEFGGFKYKTGSGVKVYCLKLFSGERINFEKSNEKINVIDCSGRETEAPVWKQQIGYEK